MRARNKSLGVKAKAAGKSTASKAVRRLESSRKALVKLKAMRSGAKSAKSRVQLSKSRLANKHEKRAKLSEKNKIGKERRRQKQLVSLQAWLCVPLTQSNILVV